MAEYQDNEEFIYGLIIEDLDGTISIPDKLILQEWRAAHVENEKTYLEFTQIESSISKLYEGHGSADASWEVLEKKLLVSDKKAAQAVVRKLNTMMVLKVAAVLVVMLSVGYYFMVPSKYAVVTTSPGASITRIVLPDETIVNLNAGTKIKYNKADFLSVRSLEVLSGEVFIQVVKHEGVQFKVIAGAVEAEDIGTSFNVVNNNSNVSVTVEEGIVALKHQSTRQKLLLTAGKVGNYNVNSKLLTIADNKDINYKSWLDKRFSFNGVVLSSVASQLEEAYQVPVVVKGAVLNKRKFTVASLHYQTIDSALAVISASLQCKVTQEKGTYVLSDN